MPLPPTSLEFLSIEEVRSQWKNHQKLTQAITQPMRIRKSRQQRHPVFDFIHTYYSFSLGRLEKWHPGVGFAIQKPEELELSSKYYRHHEETYWIDPSLLTTKGRDRLEWIKNLLEKTQARAPMLACHGLHEWAMVFAGDDVRHRESAPLRLTQTEIDEIVKTRPICCSHFDAFRFFTPSAKPLNKIHPTLLAREEYEQPGCIHANMDLYKWAYKSSPWISSKLLRETLFFAIEAREIDMRASPYDLREYGYDPIQIETKEGRREYEQLQNELYLNGLPLRQSLIDSLAKILSFSHAPERKTESI